MSFACRRAPGPTHPSRPRLPFSIEKHAVLPPSLFSVLLLNRSFTLCLAVCRSSRPLTNTTTFILSPSSCPSRQHARSPCWSSSRREHTIPGKPGQATHKDGTSDGARAFHDSDPPRRSLSHYMYQIHSMIRREEGVTCIKKQRRARNGLLKRIARAKELALEGFEPGEGLAR